MRASAMYARLHIIYTVTIDVFFGTANRRISEREGCWCYLCARHHNMSNMGVHFNKILDLKLKQVCQTRWEEIHAPDDTEHKKFIEIFGRNYL